MEQRKGNNNLSFSSKVPLVASMKTFAIAGPQRGLQSYLLRDIKWLRRTWLFTMRRITEPGPGHRGSLPHSYAWWTSPPSSPIDRRESLPRPVRARLTSEFWPQAVPAVTGFPHRRGGWPGLESILKAISRLLPSRDCKAKLYSHWPLVANFQNSMLNGKLAVEGIFSE